VCARYSAVNRCRYDASPQHPGIERHRHVHHRASIHLHRRVQPNVENRPGCRIDQAVESNTANRLRLWSAADVESFDFAAFDTGDYLGAVEDKVRSENISKILYPNDSSEAGRRLRLFQQYFFVSCSLQDALDRVIRTGAAVSGLPSMLVDAGRDRRRSRGGGAERRALLCARHVRCIHGEPVR
jgi:glucan phosphorylase